MNPQAALTGQARASAPAALAGPRAHVRRAQAAPLAMPYRHASAAHHSGSAAWVGHLQWSDAPADPTWSFPREVGSTVPARHRLHQHPSRQVAERSTTASSPRQPRRLDRDAAVAELQAFVQRHEHELNGRVPTREFLRGNGRADLCQAIKLLGGPAAVGQLLDLDWQPNRWRTCPGLRKMKHAANVQVNELGLRRGRPGEAKSMRKSAARAAVRLARARSRAADAHLEVADAQQVVQVAERMLEEGSVFVVEHISQRKEHKGAAWSLWQLPAASSAASLMAEAQTCARSFPGHAVRITAYDTLRQCEQTSFLVQTGDA
ncbi:unnamed protein product [Pedinophyceae sp. YPF-701]|nr:unnamed protein product [Pedinophyceae sp. YPF-701]